MALRPTNDGEASAGGRAPRPAADPWSAFGSSTGWTAAFSTKHSHRIRHADRNTAPNGATAVKERT
jgi:hypothetical protein